MRAATVSPLPDVNVAPDLAESGTPISPWPEIVGLSGAGPIDAFPIEELPPVVRAMVEAVAASTGTPVDFPAGIALGVLAALASRGVSMPFRRRPG